ncbi:hypothetical protein V6N13_020940 [Hibiscus sabdariffa]|uniref:Uncharacterized protein n=1 Tax=Hibiscus sabdariffa TaxID=183260 RepID=A0ABR1Z9C2_9ROSI
MFVWVNTETKKQGATRGPCIAKWKSWAGRFTSSNRHVVWGTGPNREGAKVKEKKKVGPTGPFSQCSQGVVRVVVPTGVVRWSDRKSVGQKFGHPGVGTRVRDLAVNGRNSVFFFFF